jgi:predicted O-methyltransferase YrrM
MSAFTTRTEIKIDTAHAELIRGLVIAHKPKVLLELGVGGGKSVDATLSALNFNQQTYDYTLVDNWLDFGGTIPPEVTDLYQDKLNIVTSAEKDYVQNCNKKFDFIMSDADHHQSHLWFEYVYDNLLNPGGILMYHDVNMIDPKAYPGLKEIYTKCKATKKSHYLFNKNSLPDERCDRGLLVIFKN